jgi:hypothetical protein
VVTVSLLALQARPALLAMRAYAALARGAVNLPARPAARGLAEARAGDLADLRLLPDLDRGFSPAARAAFLGGVDALIPESGGMSPARLWMETSRLVALAGNGHTSVNLVQRAAAFGRVPLRFAWFADGLYIVRATADHADLLGRRVESIDGRPVAEAFAAVRPYFSGTEAHAKSLCPPLLESPSLLQVIWPDTDGAGLTIHTVSPAGSRDDMLAALPPMPDRFSGQPGRVIGPLPDYGELAWTSVLSGAPEIPMSLQLEDHVALSRPLEGNGLYVRINANANDARGPLSDQPAAGAGSRSICVSTTVATS